jgi:hypothetical protein
MDGNRVLIVIEKVFIKLSQRGENITFRDEWIIVSRPIYIYTFIVCVRVNNSLSP